MSLSKSALLASLLLLVAQQARAAHWTKIDYDADLRTMLVDTDQISHSGDHASLWELQVEGHTAPSRGGQFHLLVKREYDCAKGTETVTAIKLFRDLNGPGEDLPFPHADFTPGAGSINATEIGMACQGKPAPANANVYATLEDAVNNAFADAVKLPASDSNRTTKGFPGMGPPPKQP